jgi:putative FmdB family regulatory protein
MPVYDYQCECGEKRTQTLSITAEEVSIICKCGKEMTRVYAVGAITFKGNGFYQTDKGKR